MKAACQKKLFDLLKTGWPGTSPPLTFNNVETGLAAGVAHAKASLLFGDSEQINVGGDLERTATVLVVQVFLPTGGGTLPASVIADAIKAVFPLGVAVRFTNGSNSVVATPLSVSGPTPAGVRDGYSQSNCECVFRVDESL